MSARRFVGYVEAFLVARYGEDAVDDWLAQSVPDEVAERRRQNALATLAAGGEVR